MRQGHALRFMARLMLPVQSVVAQTGLDDATFCTAAARLQVANCKNLPSRDLATEEKINFADTVCGL